MFMPGIETLMHSILGSLSWLIGLFPQNERTRRDQFSFSEDRRDFAMAHDLLRQFLSRYDSTLQASEWQFATTAFCKPYVSAISHKEKPIEFSLSHTSGFVACVICPTRVAIDVERITRNLGFDFIAEDYFGEEEIRSLNELLADRHRERFFELWTLKEAFLKAIGCGSQGR